MSRSSDTIGDMLTKIRNAQMAGHREVDIHSSIIKIEIARILKEEGYIRTYKVIDDRKQGVLRVFLRYGPKKEPMITEIMRISKPGKRVYAGKDKIPSILGGHGIAILTTPYGVMTDKDARNRGIGGEVICGVY
ncbi:TPA: 30S ribosomal protein S8 [bacterium]|nr:30S ribosomal protein S8 [bacterium]